MAELELLQVDSRARPASSLPPLPSQSISVSPTLSRASSFQALTGQESTLAPVDGGRKAWLFVAAATAQETLVWGFSLSYSVFQDYLPERFPDASNVEISIIGTSALALEYCSLIVLLNFYRRYPELILPFTYGALVICVVALVAASFATSIGYLIFFQGILYGIGAGTMYAPAVLWLYEWFASRRGLAGGIIFAGSGLGGAVIPLLLGQLLGKVGYGWTLRIWAAITALGSGIAMLGLKPRLPLPPKGAPRASMMPRNVGWLVSPLFVIVTATIIMQSIGLLSVSLYISPFTSSLGLMPIYGQLALALFNLSAVAGQVGIGAICDKRPYPIVMALSALLSSVIAFALWGFSNSLTLVLLFSIAFGSISGGFSSVWPAAATDVAGKQSQHAGLVFSCFAVGKAIAAVAGPSAAGALHDIATVRSTYGQSGYSRIVIFVGSMMAATCVGSLATHAVRTRRKETA